MFSLLSKILFDINHNKRFYLLSFSLVSSTIVFIPYGIFFYLLGLLYLMYNAFKMKNGIHGMCGRFLFFLVACVLSSIVSGVFNYRLATFIIIIMACTPFFNSYRLFLFREKYLKYCLGGFPLLSIGALFCYYAGINMFVAEEGDVSWDFSAFFPHPMWLGAAVGVANVVVAWYIIKVTTKKEKFIWTCVLLGSILISVVSASRSALFASLGAIAILIYICSPKPGIIIKNILFISIIAYITLPLYQSFSGRMSAKFSEGEEYIYGSRTERWKTQYKHFLENPITGNGFAVNYYGNQNHRVVGRSETGSGWLSIIFQTGILGAIGMLIIIIPIFKCWKYMREDTTLQLICCSFIFLCLHSVFEGYILTAGYYLCVLFWTELGYLMAYPFFRKRLVVRKQDNVYL